MWKISLPLLMGLHGLIHLMGFVKAFGWANIEELKLPVSKPLGVLWLAAAALFVFSAITHTAKNEHWWKTALLAVLLSQLLIVYFWRDAWFGTLPNLMIALAALAASARPKPPPSNVAAKHGLEIYETAAAADVYCPFDLAVDPMERLLLVNFEKDPDAIYLGFEPQVFDDTTNGRGMLVIAWRQDGKVDVYHQPGLRLDPAKYDIAGKGLARMAPRPMEDAVFDIGSKGVDVYFSFADLDDRPVEVRIKEGHSRPRKPFGLLAPMGQAASAPSAMPLVLLRDFYFVRRAHTEVEIKIDGRVHQPDKLPVPMDGAWMYFMRYSANPFIVTFNPARDGVLPPLRRENASRAEANGTHYELAANGDQLDIRRMYRRHNDHTIEVTFQPALPNIAALADGARAQGVFTIAGHPSTGLVWGEYMLRRWDEHVELEARPVGGWIPNESKLSVRFMYLMVKTFTQWPKTYRWRAELQREVDGGYGIWSAWERIGQMKRNTL
jgi:hypothetical protein